MLANRSCATDPRDVSTWERCSMYRGQLRLALLRCLMEGEMHGLKMINRIKDVTGGDWQPSPGSVYPLLQEFDDISLVNKREAGRSVYYSLTEKGEKAFYQLHSEVKKQMDFLDWVMDADN